MSSSRCPGIAESLKVLCRLAIRCGGVNFDEEIR
jgi:hypothetical protein